MDSTNVSIILLTIAVICNAVGMISLRRTIDKEIKPHLAILTALSPLNKIPKLAKNHDEQGIKDLLDSLESENVKFHFVNTDNNLFSDENDNDEDEED